MRTTMLALAVVALSFACATSRPTASNTNQDACKRYAEHLNALAPCVGLTYDPDNWCAGVDRLPVDMTTYYDCLRTNASCEGEVSKIEIDRCTPPLVKLVSDAPALGSEHPLAPKEGQ